MKHTWRKRLLCLTLCGFMLLGNLPGAAMAEELPEELMLDAVTEETAAEIPEETAEAHPEAVEVVSRTIFLDTEDWPSNEELFAAYAEGILYGNLPATFGTSAYERLPEGNTKLAYEALKPELEKIARGQRESTVFTLGYAFKNVHFTDGSVRDLPAELPVAFQGTQLDYDLLLHSLTADMPYEMYWFAKSLGMAISYVPVNGKLNLTLKFAVAGNCSADGSAGGFAADRSITGAAAAAAANAQSVVNSCAGLSDYEKLVYYKEYICGAVSYDWAAYYAYLANAQYSALDADPWQLIHVFDGIQSTNVVCEGYAKAYQYLCDLTEFSRDETGKERVVCYSIIGEMDGGGHMWNIVTIDGAPYMADITNSDNGSAGQNGGLFLVGGEPNADGSYTFRARNSNILYTYGNAAYSLWGSDVLTLSTQGEYEPPCLNHSYGPWEVTKAATATVTGQEQRVCSLCEEIQTRKLIPVVLTATAESAKVTAGAKPEDVAIGLSASLAIGGAQVTDLELEYVITNGSGKVVSLEEALATPGTYTITPKVKTP